MWDGTGGPPPSAIERILPSTIAIVGKTFTRMIQFRTYRMRITSAKAKISRPMVQARSRTLESFTSLALTGGEGVPDRQDPSEECQAGFLVPAVLIAFAPKGPVRLTYESPDRHQQVDGPSQRQHPSHRVPPPLRRLSFVRG